MTPVSTPRNNNDNPGSSRQVPEEEAGVQNDYMSQQYLQYHCTPDPGADDEMEQADDEVDNNDEELASSNDEEQMKQ